MTHNLADRLTVFVFVLVFGLGIGLIAVDPVASAPSRVEIRIRYSRYEPASISVPYGRQVTFVLRNEDPIGHEWIVGDETLHDRHKTGTEPFHASRPTEVSIPPLSTVETTVTFDEPVSWRFVCQLPGHEAYGMVGSVSAN